MTTSHRIDIRGRLHSIFNPDSLKHPIKNRSDEKRSNILTSILHEDSFVGKTTLTATNVVLLSQIDVAQFPKIIRIYVYMYICIYIRIMRILGPSYFP